MPLNALSKNILYKTLFNIFSIWGEQSGEHNGYCGA